MCLTNLTILTFLLCTFQMELSRENLRVILYYCWKRKMTAAAAGKEVNDVLGSGTITARTCQNLFHKFSSGDFDITDAARSGRPSLDIDDRIEELLQDNPHHSCRSLSIELEVSPNTISSHLRAMGKRYLTTCWIPHKLSEENKAARVRCCEDLLKLIDHFLIQKLFMFIFLQVIFSQVTKNRKKLSGHHYILGKNYA